MTFTHALATNNYGPAKFIVATSAANGTHTTLASAMTAASSGDTIFLRDSVTENVTITPGVNITAWSGGSLNTPSITGTLTMTGAGTSTISGLELITNSSAIIAVTGSAASILNVNDCYLNISNNDGMTFSSSSASAKINIYKCTGDLGTTGIKIFTHTSAGQLLFYYCRFTNSGASTTASTASAGALISLWSNFSSPITTSSTTTMSMYQTVIDSAAQNATPLTAGGSGTQGVALSQFYAGTASAISAGTALSLFSSFISSSNTNAITGAGTLNYSGLSFQVGSSYKINTTTQAGGILQGGVAQAPSAGFIGENIVNTQTLGSIVCSNGVATNMTSISVTAGIWDISGAVTFGGAAGSGNVCIASIGTTSATLGTLGVNAWQVGPGPVSGVYDQTSYVPPVRFTFTTTTTVYLVAQLSVTAGTIASGGRISATRVG